MKKWRFVDHLDDGHTSSQCLSCKGKFGGNCEWSPFVYCPLCGIRFEGQHKCRHHSNPRWEYEYEQRTGGWPPYRPHKPGRFEPNHKWVIEVKCGLFDDMDWEADSCYFRSTDSAHYVWTQLMKCRALQVGERKPDLFRAKLIRKERADD